MRYTMVILTLVLLLVPFLLTMTDDASASKEDPIVIRLSVQFEEKDRGHLRFSMGNIYPSALTGTDRVPLSCSPYKNDNMDRLLKAFRTRGRDNESYFRMVFNCDGGLELENVEFSQKVDRNYFVVMMEVNFSYETSGVDAEFEYLNMVKHFDDHITREQGENLLDYNLRRINEIDKVSARISIELPEGLSMSSMPSLSGHSRDLSGESISETIDASSLISGSNELKVYDHVLLSPGFALFSTIFYLLTGLGLLGYIWYRNRFRGVGLILPIITIIAAVFVVFNYTTPSINFHSLGSATIWIWGAVFLGLVIACNHVNPQPKFRSYDEEMEDQPKLQMPDVVYVDRKVLVEKRVRMSEEEAMDPYEVLEVSKRASFEEIEKAYKSRVKEYHPDKFDGTPKRIHEAARKETERLNMAYEKVKKQHRR